MKCEELTYFLMVAREVLQHENVIKMQNYIQHGSVNCLQHSFIVAYYSYSLMKKLQVHVDEYALIRGALLHDYFLYDWHDHEKWHRLHGFRHPNFAYQNAKRDFQINEIEADIIKKHMWPLTLVPPVKKESWIVTTVDKTSSIMEIFIKYKVFHHVRKRFFDRKLALLEKLMEEL